MKHDEEINSTERQVDVMDTTLRDGEQSPGIAFSVKEKIQLAELLINAGVRELEIGVPAMGGEEFQSIRELNAMFTGVRLFSWNRASMEDVESSFNAGSRSLFITAPVSDIQIKNKLNKPTDWIIRTIVEAVRAAKDNGCYVGCGMEDSSRANLSFLKELLFELKLAGADRIRISDTIGIFTPGAAFDFVKKVQAMTDLPLEFHGHNDFGLATANSIAAVEAGARFVDTTVMGIGERAGNAALEEVAMSIKYLLNKDTGINPSFFSILSRYLTDITGILHSKWKPITGSNIFTHESGIHVDGIMKNPINYEPFPPEIVDAQRKIVIGKHTSSKTLESRFREIGIEITKDQAKKLLPHVMEQAILMKRNISNTVLIKMYMDLIGRPMDLK